MTEPIKLAHLERAIAHFEDLEAEVRRFRARYVWAKRRVSKPGVVAGPWFQIARSEFESAQNRRAWAAVELARLLLKVIPKDRNKAAVLIARRELEGGHE